MQKLRMLPFVSKKNKNLKLVTFFVIYLFLIVCFMTKVNNIIKFFVEPIFKIKMC